MWLKTKERRACALESELEIEERTEPDGGMGVESVRSKACVRCADNCL